MLTSKNVLITGGAGFIGSNLALQLLKKGYKVTVLDNLSSQIHGKNPEKESPLYQSILGKVNFILGDVTCREDWERAIENQDIIVHFAAETGTGQSMYLIEKYNRVNALGTAIMMDVLMHHKNSVKKIILASSRAIYGEGKYLHPTFGAVFPAQRNNDEMLRGNFEIKWEDGTVLKAFPTDENSKIHPTSVYGITKSYQEEIIRTVASSQGIKYSMLRYQNVYGAGQSLLNPYTGILSVFTSQILNGKPINVFEDGRPSRDFVYVDDAVAATVLAIENVAADNTELNVGAGKGVSIMDVAQKLVEIYQKPTDIAITGTFRVGDIRHNLADLSKISELLNYTPRISFDEGVVKFAEWALKQQVVDNNFKRSLEEMRENGLLKS